MARPSAAPGEKPLDWVGSSLDDLKRFPARVQDEIGIALSVAQFGRKHPSAKPWTGLGPGTFQITENHKGDTYRAVCTVEFSDRIYVLHAFQKKSKSGIKTTQSDRELIEARYKAARADYQKRLASKVPPKIKP